MFVNFLVITTLLAVAAGQGDIDSIIDSIFTKPPNENPATQAPAPFPTLAPTNTKPNPTPEDGVNPLCKGGECVPYYLCNNNQINTDGENVIDIRFNEDDPPECPSVLLICCGSGDVVDQPIPPPPPTSSKTGCGYRNFKGVGGFQISGGSAGESEYGEFPWMVAILKETQTNDQILNVYQCGGSLIHPSVVLTAAHCVNNKVANELKIRAGEWDTQSKREIYAHQDRDVASFVMHEAFSKGSLANDVALIFLTQPVELTPSVQTVCLPPQNCNFDNSRCTASGWGKDVFGKEGKYQVILKKIELPIVPYQTCQAAFRTTRLGVRFNLHESFICAGGERGKDTCRGDGGSPLVCPISGSADRYYQAGVVAWGIGCGEEQIPGAYGKIAIFRNWIDNQFNNRQLDSRYYNP